MAGSLKIAGLPVNARYHRLDSWQVKRMPGHDDRFVLWRDSRGEWESVNVWAVRDKFRAIRTVEDALAFFRLFGPLSLDDQATEKQGPIASMEEPMGNVLRYQRWCDEFISEPTPVVGSTPPPAEFGGDVYSRRLAMGWHSPAFTVEAGFVRVKRSKEAKEMKVLSPYLNLKTYDVVSAVHAATYIDKMRGLRGGICQRPECRNTFLTLDPRKRFCDDAGCGSVVRMRNKRSRERIGGVNGKA